MRGGDTYRVEGRVPKTAKDRVATPEARSRDSRGLANEGRDNRADNEDTETGTGASSRADKVTEEDTNEEGEDVASVVDEVADETDLVDRVSPAV